ncbi:hypothetical protein OLMES_1583 [Oleiphilus messinensis]|uniref:Uncharacterized protein n=1 Tax=Oleiphilus messinensis TaxID=141451 RepID=A0A1Y0I595_9GAMM|nr:hypothetical protein OLMES_1583 [Oleiphilus messinensis]
MFQKTTALTQCQSYWEGLFRANYRFNSRTFDFTSNQWVTRDGNIVTRGYETSYIKLRFNEETGHLFIDKMTASSGTNLKAFSKTFKGGVSAAKNTPFDANPVKTI